MDTLLNGRSDEITRLTRQVTLVEQELLTFLVHLRSSPVFSGVHVTRSLVLCVCFVDRCLSICTFSFGHCVVCYSKYGFCVCFVDRCLSFCPVSFGHCVVCSSSIFGFWLPLWYLQTLLIWTADWTNAYSKTWIQTKGFISRFATKTAQYDNTDYVQFDFFHTFVSQVYWSIEHSLINHCIFICICGFFITFCILILFIRFINR